MQSKTWLILASVIIVVGVFVVANKNGAQSSQTVASNVSVADGQQIITMTAKGGFSPATTTAEAGVPSVLRVSTIGTYDCSSSISIPSLGYSKNLAPNGTTDIEIPAQVAGTTINGTCSMGMYRFAIAFK